MSKEGKNFFQKIGQKANGGFSDTASKKDVSLFTAQFLANNFSFGRTLLAITIIKLSEIINNLNSTRLKNKLSKI